jgi:hypothetical protein
MGLVVNSAESYNNMRMLLKTLSPLQGVHGGASMCSLHEREEWLLQLS